MSKKSVVVFGAGYVGLSLGCLLAEKNRVTLVDVVESKVSMINEGLSPIADQMIEEVLRNGSLDLVATLNPGMEVANADYIIIATPTNYDSEANSFNLDSIEGVLEQIAEYNPESIIVIKSTVPVGYTSSLSERYPSLRLLFSPEFLREGCALADNLRPSRIVVGIPGRSFHDSLRSEAAEFSDLLLQAADEEYRDSIQVLITGSTEAEAVKLFSNTYLALRVAYFNELDTYAMRKSLDCESIIKGVCLDPRIGDYYNNPSFGYGGYCLPKDTKQLLANYEGVPQNLIRAIVESNETRKREIVDSVLSMRPGCVGVYKLAMKSGSDNFRESSIVDIAKGLRAGGVQVIVYEPSLNVSVVPEVELVNDLAEFKSRSDVIICNRISSELDDVLPIVFTRDVFHEG